jgi:hypothetical protein
MKHPDAFISPLSTRRRRPRPPPLSDCCSSTLCQQSIHRHHHHAASLTRIQAAPFLLRNVVSRAPSPATAAAFLVALLVGYMLGKRRRSHSLVLDNANTTHLQPIEVSRDGLTPLWLNYGFRKLWKLVQKNTKQFAQEAIQPVIDDTEMPDFVKDVRLVQYTVGRKAPVVRDLKPVPARSLAELQCTFQAQFRSTSDLTFEVDIVVPKRENNTITIPVSLSNLQIDALVWSAFTLAPYQPYFTTWRFSLLETPKVAFDMNVASALPVTSIPGLRSLFFRIICKEIPKDFMFPLANTVDFTPDKERAKKEEFINMTVEEIDELSADEIKVYCPKEWALYSSLDLDNTGSLEKQDLVQGLADWGYSTSDAQEVSSI